MPYPVRPLQKGDEFQRVATVFHAIPVWKLLPLSCESFCQMVPSGCLWLLPGKSGPHVESLLAVFGKHFLASLSFFLRVKTVCNHL